MEYSDELCKLVIRNAAILEEAPKVAEHVDEVLIKAINERIEKLVKEKGWIGVFERISGEYDQTLFRPDAWNMTQSDEFDENAYYDFFWTEEGKPLNYCISVAAQVDGSGFSFGFWIPEGITGMKNAENRKKLRALFEETPKLRELGFELRKDGYIFTRFAFDAEQLEKEYPDFSDSLNPLDDAFDRLLKAHPVFDAYVKSFKNTDA